VRVVAQLIDAETDEHLWAKTYDRDLEDVFSVQTDVAESLALALLAELSPEEREKIRTVPTESLEAYDRFTRALQAYQRMLPRDLAQAESHCREAIRLDPAFAEAYAVLAHCHVMAGFYANEHPRELFPKVHDMAKRALELNPGCGEAHTALAAFRLHFEWDSEGTARELARAFALNADSSGAHIWNGEYHLCHGRFAEAEAAARQALVSDPLSPLGHHNLSKTLALSGKPREALRVSEAAVGLWPDLPILHLWIGTSHFLMDEPELALPSFEEAAALSGNLPFFESMRGFGLAVLGRREEAREALEGLKARSRAEYVDPYNLFQVTAALEGLEDALPYLEEAVEVRSGFLPYLGVIPPYRPLHDHPRFRAVLERVWPGVRFEV
jgi:tetratricopeptide (TPR) repeat protein